MDSEETLLSNWKKATNEAEAATERVQKLKAEKASKEEILKAVSDMKSARELASTIAKDLFLPEKLDIDHDAFENLLVRRFFICPSFSIYGGAKGFYDFGPPGCAVKNNLLAFWRQFFVLEENMLEIDTATVTPAHVLEASGHVKKFNDSTVKDLTTGAYHRADHLLEDAMTDLLKQSGLSTDKIAEYRSVRSNADEYKLEQLAEVLKKYSIKSPEGNEISEPFAANLMLETTVGQGKSPCYLRPETAQGIFVNFGRLLDYNGQRLPFAASTIGTAYRNEIAPRAGLLRVREFTMAEIEHFCFPDEKDHPKFASVADTQVRLLSVERQEREVPTPLHMSIGDAVKNKVIQNETVGYFMARVQLFLLAIGIKPQYLLFRQHKANEMAHYAKDCWDAEILTSHGWIEALGIADRSCYDLGKHAKASGARMTAFRRFDKPKEVEELVLTPSKSAIGKEYKRDAKPLIEYLSKLSQDDVIDFHKQMESGETTVNVNDKEYVVKSNMVDFKTVKKKISGENVVPSVIEPSFGIGRIMYALLEHSFYTRESDSRRTVVGLSPVIAPVKCSVLPLQQDSRLNPVVSQISSLLTSAGISNKVDDVGQSIGKRYARTDEIGIPFGITVDFDTVEEKERGDKPTVTLRDRDSTKQIRIPIDEITPLILRILRGEASWLEASANYPAQE